MAVTLPDPFKMGRGPERSFAPSGSATIPNIPIAPVGRFDASAITQGGLEFARAIGSQGEVGTAYMRGMDKLSEAETRGGLAIGAATGNLGKGVSDFGGGLLKIQEANDQLDFARARANYFTSKTNLDASFDRDTQWQDMPARYTTELEKVRSNSGDMISNPAMRERFYTDTSNNVAEANRRSEQQSFKLERSDRLGEADVKLKELKNSALIAKEEDRGEIVGAASDLINGLAAKKYLEPREAQKLRSQWTEEYAVASVQSLPAEQQVNLLRTAPTDKEAWLDRTGKVENATGNPAVRAKTSSAMGDFQFTEGTWLDTVSTHRPDLLQGRSSKEVLALRADPSFSREMAGYLYDDNAKTLRENGIVPSPANLYLAHFLGAGGAVSVLKAQPGTPVSDVIDPKSVKANRSILEGKTVDSVVDWAAQKMGGQSRGSGSVIDYIPEDKRINLLNQATTQVVNAQRKVESDTAFEDYNVKQAVKNDVLSTLNTGQGDMSLDVDRVRRVLGSKGALEWQSAREDAHATWVNTQDLAALPDTAIQKRLDDMEPVGGTPDYGRKQVIYEKVKEKADEVRKQRQIDPAGSVSDDPKVKEAQAAVTQAPNDPDAQRTLSNARMAAQEKVGIPDDSRSPITKDEAVALTVPLRRMLPGQEREVLTQIGEDFQKRFGEDADTAFSYALRVHRVEGEVAKQAARVLRKLGLGDTPTPADAGAVDSASDISAASKAVTGVSTVPTIDPMTGTPMSAPSGAYAPEKGQLMPPARAIEMLRADPSLGPAFDRKYGAGLSKRILDKYPLR